MKRLYRIAIPILIVSFLLLLALASYGPPAAAEALPTTPQGTPAAPGVGAIDETIEAVSTTGTAVAQEATRYAVIETTRMAEMERQAEQKVLIQTARSNLVLLVMIFLGCAAIVGFALLIAGGLS